MRNLYSSVFYSLVLAYIPVLVFFIGCGNGGGGNDSSSSTPVINNVVITDWEGNETNLFRGGDSVYVEIEITDSDLDVSYLETTTYYEDNPSDPVEGPNVIWLDSQSQPTMVYSAVRIGFISTDEPSGSRHTDFQVIDKKTNESNIITEIIVIE